MLYKQKCFNVIFSNSYLHKKELLHKHKYVSIFTKLKIFWRSGSSELMHFHHFPTKPVDPFPSHLGDLDFIYFRSVH